MTHSCTDKYISTLSLKTIKKGTAFATPFLFLPSNADVAKLLRFTLVCYGRGFRSDFVGIAQIVMFDRFEVFVEFVNQWHTGRDVEFKNFVFAQIIQVFNQRTQGVTVCSDDHALAAFDTWFDNVSPVRDHAIDGQCQAFRRWQLFRAQFRITRIMAWEALIAFFQFWWCHGKATTPLFNLLVTVFFRGFSFIQTLQRAVMTSVQFPGFFNWQPWLIQFVQNAPQGMDGTFQHGGVSEVEMEAFVFQQLTGSFCFGTALVRQFNIMPTGKTVLFVPLTLAVSYQNQLGYSHS